MPSDPCIHRRTNNDDMFSVFACFPKMRNLRQMMTFSFLAIPAILGRSYSQHGGTMVLGQALQHRDHVARDVWTIGSLGASQAILITPLLIIWILLVVIIGAAFFFLLVGAGRHQASGFVTPSRAWRARGAKVRRHPIRDSTGDACHAPCYVYNIYTYLNKHRK
jgi:hypothetical protein